MANADRKHFGLGVRGKGDGTGAMTEMPDSLPPKPILSNRDKKQHSDDRGLDSKHIQNEQREDTASNRRNE